MPSDEPNSGGEGPQFVSRFDNKVDEKRRIQVPSMWRRGQTSGVRYLLLPAPKRAWRAACLMAMLLKQYRGMVQKLREMPIADDRADSLRRLFAACAVEVETDSAGRICLPEEVARTVDIKDRVTLAGMIDWFEIWNPQRYALMASGDDERSSEAWTLIEPTLTQP